MELMPRAHFPWDADLPDHNTLATLKSVFAIVTR